MVKGSRLKNRDGYGVRGKRIKDKGKRAEVKAKG